MDRKKQCEGCDNKYSGRHEFAEGWCRMYEEEYNVPERCQHYQPIPPVKYADET